ncbi:MAG: hypothetical protein MSJ26_03215 [Oscillospiraceae bacterium]|nr:hypothetical protein [Oscillospiraceae bacterium]
MYYDDVPGAQVKLPENSTGFVNIGADYYYPEEMKGDPDSLRDNAGLTRYSISLLRSGARLSFIAEVGDNEVTVYSSEEIGESYVRTLWCRTESFPTLSM